MFNPVLQGWIHYYGRFYKSAMYPTLRHMNRALVHWVRRKYKRFHRHRRRAEYWLGRVARRDAQLCAHWQMGIKPAAEGWEPDELRGSCPVLRAPGGAIPPGDS